MSKTNADDGGPAFPVPGNPATQPGMSLRDYFAAKAMAALVGQQVYSEYVLPETVQETLEQRRYTFTHETFFEGAGDVAQLARFSYVVADAMLRARAAQ